MHAIRLGAVSIAAFAIVLTLNNSAAAINGTPSWFSQQVAANEPDHYISTPTLSFDHFGSSFVSWSSVTTAAGSNTVRLSQRGSLGLWNTRDMTSGVGLGLRTSLAFDRSERPAVGWVNVDGSVRGSFNYAADQQIAASGASFTNPVISLGYDLAGSMRGMFAGSSAGNFSSVSHNGASFSSGAMAALQGIGTIFDAAFTTDDHGLRHIAARADVGGNKAIILASEPAGGGPWASSVFATAASVDGVDISRDPTDGRIGFAYTTFDNNTSRLFYAKFNGIQIQTTEITGLQPGRYEDVSLAFDPTDGKPAIAYELRNGSVGELWLAYQNPASQWLQSSVDDSISIEESSGAARKPSLAFDDYGTSWPAIAYIDSDNSLAVAFDPPVPEPTSIVLILLPLLAHRRRRV
jgi:hypothetical protein